MSDIQVTAVDGNQINVSTGTVAGPLPELQIAAGNGINITSSNGVSTISANLTIPANLADLGNVDSTPPSAGEALAYNGTAWIPSNLSTNLSGYATESFVNSSINSSVSNLVGSAPASLDTLEELASAIGNDANFSLTLATALSGKATVNHSHQISDITGLQGALNGISSGNYTLSLGSLTDVAVDNVQSGEGIVWDGSAWVPSGILGTQSLSPTDLTMIQTVEGLQTFLWDGSAESGFEVEIVALSDTASDVSSNSTLTTESDGSLKLIVDMNATYVDGLVIAATDNNIIDWEEVFFESANATTTNLTISGIYLSEEFSTPGNYTLSATILDLNGDLSAETGPINVSVAAHGSPVAPAVGGFSWEASNLSVEVAAITTPHMNGFYSLDDITYYLETAESENATTWSRSSGLAGNATATSEFNVQNLNSSAPLYGRVVAVNPLGEGEPSGTTEL